MNQRKPDKPAPYPAGTSRLILRMAKILLQTGMPAHRVESAMQVVARSVGLSGEFMATPTSFFAALGDGTRQRTLMVRANPGSVNLEQLADLSEVMEALESKALTLPEAANRLEAIAAKPPRYNGWVASLGFAFSSSALAVIFGANAFELLCAFGVGLLVGLLHMLMNQSEGRVRLFEPAAATIAAFTAMLIGSQLPQVSPFLVTLSGLIVLLPGLSITVATRELAGGELVSGSARMAGAAIVLLGLTFGMALGTQLGYFVVDLPVPRPFAALPEWAKLGAIIAAALGFTVLLRARPVEFPWILAACALGAVSGMLGNAWLGEQLGAFVGGFTVGVGGNLFSRVIGRPAVIVQYPGLILLVPGSIGFSSLAALMQADVLGGIQTAFSAVMIAMALTTGLLMSSLLLPPKREL